MAPGERPREGGVRDTSTHTIRALARFAGAEVGPAALVGDDLTAITAALAAARESADVVVISGGVSVGRHDHVRPALRALGARESFWGVALKPGRPTWFGTLDGTPVFGLPGNPVSAMVTFTLLVRPALRALQGAAIDERRWSAVLDRDYEKPSGRVHAVRCRLRAQDDGWHAQPTGAQGSHILTSMLGADALAIVPRNVTTVRAGERVAIEPLHGNFGAPA
jgi:molybdopterin molybdotransferase